MEWFILWLLCGFIAAFITERRGSGVVVGFFLGAILGPFGILIALTFGGTCPACRSRIHLKATRCPKCQADLTPTVVTTAAPLAPPPPPPPTPPAPRVQPYTVPPPAAPTKRSPFEKPPG
jgi:uncharacterized membrane protein YeaQ/YmgE (transglycosylase-associated protein family)